MRSIDRRYIYIQLFQFILGLFFRCHSCKMIWILSYGTYVLNIFIYKLLLLTLVWIILLGRSNVGKSSLLNALTRQWGVVRTSDKPGLTQVLHLFLHLKLKIYIGHTCQQLTILLQSINFFKLGPKLCMVDLPGYGFAYAKEEVKEAWEELVSILITNRTLFCFSSFFLYLYFPSYILEVL